MAQRGHKASIFLLALLFLAFPCGSALGASQKVVILVSSDQGPFVLAADGIQDRLAQQGKGLEVRRISLSGDRKEGEEMAARMAAEGVDLVIALGSIATSAASQHLTGIPIVAGMVLDIDRGSGNMTGVQLEIPLTVQLEWMKRFLPTATTVGIVYNPQENQEKAADLIRVAQERGIRVEGRSIAAPSELLPALESLGSGIDVLLGMTDSVALTPQTAQKVLLYSFRNRIPFVGMSEAWVKAGALYALDRDYRDIGVQCAEMALRLLGGAKLPEVSPTFPRKVLYSLNLKTAEQMRLKPAAGLVEGAAKVY